MTLSRRLLSTVLLGAGLSTAALSLVAQPNAQSMAKILYSFMGGSDGKGPAGPLIADDAGTLYGATSDGGGSSACFSGCGTIFKYANNQETVLYAFPGGTDGYFPHSGLARDAAGSLYGTTSHGGAADLGIVFKLDPNGVKTTLHSFVGGSADGASPGGELLLDAEGNLWGTTIQGGNGSCDGGCGTVYKITPNGVLSIIHSFDGSTGGGVYPSGGVVPDGQGNLVGTTSAGGLVRPACSHRGCGTLYSLAPDGTESTIYAFTGGAAGFAPGGRPAMDAQGNLYGPCAGGTADRGAIYKVTPDGQESILYSFLNHGDGYGSSELIVDSAGYLYGNSAAGGQNYFGLVFRLSPSGHFSVIHTFDEPLVEGAFPTGALLLDRRDNLIGANNRYGAAGDNGSLFAVHR